MMLCVCYTAGSSRSLLSNFTLIEYLQIYRQMDQVFHNPDSLYCILTSLNHPFHSLLTNEDRGVTITEIPQCPS